MHVDNCDNRNNPYTVLARVCSSVCLCVQAATLHKETFGDDVALPPALLNHLKANTIINLT